VLVSVFAFSFFFALRAVGKAEGDVFYCKPVPKCI